jgi:FkbM family methyltransferase
MKIMIKATIKTIMMISLVSALSVSADPNEYIRGIVKKLLPENPIILEAGAYNGGDVIKSAQMWSKGTIYAFEPMPNLFEQLKAKTKNFHNVHCYQIALSDATGTAKFYVSSGSSDMSSSLLKPKDHLKYHPDVFFTKTIEVQAFNLDEWAHQNNVDHIDFMWLDMQGSEMAMLQAAPKILKTVQVIFTEVNKFEVYAGCPTYPVMKAWFESQGFVAVIEDLDTWVDFGDVLFVRKSK